MRGRESSTRCSRRRTTVSAGDATGSTSRAMPTPTASSRTSTGPTPGAIATTSSTSLNQDKPYNQFLKEQIAGDEIDGKSNETLIATGFLRAGPRVNFPREGQPRAALGLRRRSDQHRVGRGTLGLTVNCARCHNHKFDPIPQKDYYSLAAALNGVRRNRGAARAAAEAEAYAKANKEIDAKIAPLRKQTCGDRKALPRAAEDRIHQEGVSRERAARRLQGRRRSARQASSCSRRRF